MKNFSPKVSIIIPLYVVSERFFNDLEKYRQLNYPNLEILVVSDVVVKIKVPKVKVIITGSKQTGPAEKRDLAIAKAKGSICAFIDDDAYPGNDWLKNAVKWFLNSGIVAVGGPGVTPREDAFWQKVSGDIVESFLCSGGVQYRYYAISKRLFVVDYPAYNLLVLTSVLKKVGGYGCNYYGGEDTFLCRKLIKYGNIVYDPDVLVYHHRRKFPIDHCKQIGNVGMHRGYFFKRYPDTSRQLFYLLPICLTFGLVSLILLSFFYTDRFWLLTITGLVFFWFLGAYSVFRHNVSVIRSIIAGFGIILTHVVYGVYFVKGLIVSKLSR